MATQIDLRDQGDGRGDGQRGRQAESPADIPAKGWKDVLVRTFRDAKRDHILLLAAGVAFFGLLALVPTLIAVVSLYGLVADPSDVTRQVNDLLGAAPSGARDVIVEQLRSITSDAGSTALIGLIAGLAVALWSASSGVKHLIDALNAAYDEDEGRGFFKVRGLSLLLTLGAIAFFIAAVAILTVVPALVEGSALGDATRMAISIARWPALAVAFVVALAVLYRYGPSRDEPEWRWVSPGAIVATVLWLIGSALFALYVSSFGSYNETYGSLGGVVVAMLWLLLTALAAVLGAELDSQLERQTRKDTTEGRDRRMGRRGAYAADTVGPTAEQTKADDERAKASANS